jgi:hypothetical protein
MNKEGEGEMGGHSEREGVPDDLFKKFSPKAHSELFGPSEPTYPFDTCINDLYSHSWSDRVGIWLWVPKGNTLVEAESSLEFPARRSEIQNFGWSASRILKVIPRRVEPRRSDSRR